MDAFRSDSVTTFATKLLLIHNILFVILKIMSKQLKKICSATSNITKGDIMISSYDKYKARINDERFVIPLESYHFSIRYVSVLPKQQIQEILPDFISSAVIKALSAVSDCPKNALSIKIGSSQEGTEFSSENDITFISISNNVPVYDFYLYVGNKTIQLQKSNTSLNDLICTIPIIEALFNNLFSHSTFLGEDSVEHQVPSLADILGISDRIYAITHGFQHKVAVTNHIANRNQLASNTELIKKTAMTSLNPHPGITYQEHNCPFGALNPESLLRGDISLNFEKTMASKLRQIGIHIEHPFNIKQRDIDLHFQYSTNEDRSKVELTDILDITTPFEDFYRDLILNRFLPNYFYDINFDVRL